jgi:hypothetical protein
MGRESIDAVRTGVARVRRAARRAPGVLAVTLALIGSTAPVGPRASDTAAPTSVSPHVWHGVAEVVALGDTHGSYEPVLALLQRLGLANDVGQWSGGRTHLVLVGDLVDRGPRERDLLDLVRELVRQAELVGGRVHVLLGNHEIFALVRDLRYVAPEAYRGWKSLERREDREAAWERYVEREGAVSAGDRRRLREVFDAAHPPGYFGRMRALEPGGVYGDWLLKRPSMIRINGSVFVHGGLTEASAALGYAGVSRGVREAVRSFWEARRVLERAGRIDPFDNYQRAMQTAAAVSADDTDPDLQAAARRMRAFVESPAAAVDGPLWYRGISIEDERLERGPVQRVLAALDAERLVLGHSITAGKTITSRFGGSVLRADVGLAYGADPQALYLAGRTAKVFNLATGRLTDPSPEHPGGEGWVDDFGEFTDVRLERFLESASIADVRELGRGSTRPLLVVLERGDVRKRAVLKRVDVSAEGELPADRWHHEVAAYRLDRLLDLDLVPVTVERDAGEHGTGSLQWWVTGAIDELSVERYDLAREIHPPLAPSIARIPLWDALIANVDRRPTDVLYVPRAGQVLLIDHSKAFTLETTVERWLGPGPCEAEFGFLFALRGLREREVRRQLSPWLDETQIEALLARRASILDRCTPAPASAPPDS